MIVENLKLLSVSNKLVDDEISPTPLPGRPNTPTKDTKKSLIDDEFTTIKRSEDLKRKN